jgi:hypothetical protein
MMNLEFEHPHNDGFGIHFSNGDDAQFCMPKMTAENMLETPVSDFAVHIITRTHLLIS